MVKRKFNFIKFIIVVVIFILMVISFAIGFYFYMIDAPSENNEIVNFTVSKGDTYNSLASSLKEKGLIKSELVYKVYIKFYETKPLDYGNYELSKSMSVKELINKIEEGVSTISVTFVEGKNMRYIINNITKNFDIKEKDILNKLKDENYLNELIDKYWFLTDEIKNKDIYYSLEGYLYPDTYQFYSNASIENIFTSMLNNTESKLKSYKSKALKSKYSVHEMMTLASMIELEAGSSNDRKGVAGVFYNRLSDNWSLGSDVTTYYAEKIDDWTKDLKLSQLNSCNAYNTRSSCMIGKLPVGPICNPGLESIAATIEPTKHNYYYFVADKNGKTYFSKTDSEHLNTISRLKSEGLWIEYQS